MPSRQPDPGTRMGEHLLRGCRPLRGMVGHGTVAHWHRCCGHRAGRRSRRVETPRRRPRGAGARSRGQLGRVTAEARRARRRVSRDAHAVPAVRVLRSRRRHASGIIGSRDGPTPAATAATVRFVVDAPPGRRSSCRGVQREVGALRQLLGAAMGRPVCRVRCESFELLRTRISPRPTPMRERRRPLAPRGAAIRAAIRRASTARRPRRVPDARARTRTTRRVPKMRA